MTKSVWLTVLVAVAAGCGGSSTLSCSMIPNTCEDDDNWPGGADQERQNCTAARGTPHDGPCDRTGSLGGCRLLYQGTTITLWFYSESAYPTVAAVMQYCTLTQRSFVAP